MSNSFTYRSEQSEILDSSVDKDLLFKNLHELDLLNTYLGGYYTSISGIKRMVTDRQRVYHIVDIGCGSGSVLKKIALWARKNNFKVKLTGVDINPETIEFLKDNCRLFPEIQAVANDYAMFLKNEKHIDIVHCSLFLHHLNNAEILNLFFQVKNKINIGCIINDLSRNKFSFYAAKFLTTIFNASVAAKHDGPVSVLKGFKHNELEELLKAAEIKNYSIRRLFGYRYLILIMNLNSK